MPYHGRIVPLALPTECGTHAARWQLISQAPWSLLGVPVYQLRLWAAGGFDPSDYINRPFVLAIDFERELDGPGLAEHFLADMRRAGRFSEAQAQHWLTQLQAVFALVKAHDRVSAEHDGRGEVRFCHNGALMRTMQDADFARLFLGLCLSAHAAQPPLPAQRVSQVLA